MQHLAGNSHAIDTAIEQCIRGWLAVGHHLAATGRKPHRRSGCDGPVFRPTAGAEDVVPRVAGGGEGEIGIGEQDVIDTPFPRCGIERCPQHGPVIVLDIARGAQLEILAATLAHPQRTFAAFVDANGPAKLPSIVPLRGDELRPLTRQGRLYQRHHREVLGATGDAGRRGLIEGDIRTGPHFLLTARISTGKIGRHRIHAEAAGGGQCVAIDHPHQRGLVIARCIGADMEGDGFARPHRDLVAIADDGLVGFCQGQDMALVCVGHRTAGPRRQTGQRHGGQPGQRGKSRCHPHHQNGCAARNVYHMQVPSLFFQFRHRRGRLATRRRAMRQP